MKRIVICCDGTWNRLDAPHPTNVARLAQIVRPEDDKGAVQLTWHLDGVGSGHGTGALAQGFDRLVGGAFGHGLMDRIAEAYRFLVFNYVPGDRIYLFGFSRGAYMARSIGGMIRNCGILERAHAGRLPEALALYRAKDKHPNAEESLDFRASYAAHTMTSEDELEWRKARRRPTEGAVQLGVQYLGVWDTVGALGVPENLLVAGVLNQRHAFHDTALSSSVHAARHAVAIDERRATFPPTLWSNLDALNAEKPGGHYREAWFPGDHGSVGGGGDITALANDALLWVLEGAEAEGLAVDRPQRDRLSATCDALGPLSCRSGGSGKGLLNRLLRVREVDRVGPATVEGLSAAARRRWAEDPSYRPVPLRRLGL
jgi:uncharacterized protein (DUF2235 family)